jgi:hypothetical protein
MTSFLSARRVAAFVSALTLIAPGVALAQAAPAPAPAAAPAHVRSDAREQVPAALLGMWKADIAASTYSSTPPREALRSFQYTADAKVLVTFMTVGADGAVTMGHWAAQVDGTQALEYHSNAGSTPYNVVTLTKVDERNFNLVVSRAGVTNITGTYLLSEDGQTLTYKYVAGGKETTVVYRRWTA